MTEKRFLHGILIILAMVSLSAGTPIQEVDLGSDVMYPMLFPYFSQLYQKKMPATLLFFPDWKENPERSFFEVGKKEQYNSFKGIYGTGQYWGKENAGGFHIDNINMDDYYSNSEFTDKSSLRKTKMNDGRLGFWYLARNHKIFRGVSGNLSFSEFYEREKKYEVIIPDFEWIKENKEKEKIEYKASVLAQFKLLPRGVLRVQFSHIQKHFKDIRNTLSFVEFSTYSTAEVYNYNRQETNIAIGNTFHNTNRNRTFFLNGGYGAVYYLEDQGYHYYDITMAFFESYISKKFTFDKLSVFCGLGGLMQFFLFVKDMSVLSLKERYRAFDRDNANYNYYLYFPLFLEYKFSPKISAFCSWKPKFYHIRSRSISTTSNSKSTNSKLSYAETGVGFSFLLHDRIRCIVVPYLSKKIQFTGIDLRLTFNKKARIKNKDKKIKREPAL